MKYTEPSGFRIAADNPDRPIGANARYRASVPALNIGTPATISDIG